MKNRKYRGILAAILAVLLCMSHGLLTFADFSEIGAESSVPAVIPVQQIPAAPVVDIPAAAPAVEVPVAAPVAEIPVAAPAPVVETPAAASVPMAETPVVSLPAVPAVQHCIVCGHVLNAFGVCPECSAAQAAPVVPTTVEVSPAALEAAPVVEVEEAAPAAVEAVSVVEEAAAPVAAEEVAPVVEEPVSASNKTETVPDETAVEEISISSTEEVSEPVAEEIIEDSAENASVKLNEAVEHVHVWGPWVRTIQPDLYNGIPGEDTRTCQVSGCGATETRKVNLQYVYAYVNSGCGSISPAGTSFAMTGQAMTFSFCPAQYWYVTSVVIDGTTYPVTPNPMGYGSYTFVVPAGGYHSVGVNFDYSWYSAYVYGNPTAYCGRVPKTGDDFNTGFWVAMMVISAMTAAGTLVYKKKEKLIGYRIDEKTGKC